LPLNERTVYQLNSSKRPKQVLTTNSTKSERSTEQHDAVGLAAKIGLRGIEIQTQTPVLPTTNADYDEEAAIDNYMNPGLHRRQKV